MSIYTEDSKDPNRFYVYVYLREDQTPYYIGKGQGDRRYRKGKNHCPPKDPANNIILKGNITETEAFELEIFYIQKYGRKDIGTGILRNLTYGGDGSCGYIQNQEQIDMKTKEFVIMTPEGEIIEIRNLRKYCRENNLDQGAMCGVIVGKSRHYKFWQVRSKENLFGFYPHTELKKMYIFLSPENKIYEITNIINFCKEKSLDVSCCYKISKRKKKHTKHWQVRNKNDFFDFYPISEL